MRRSDGIALVLLHSAPRVGMVVLRMPNVRGERRATRSIGAPAARAKQTRSLRRLQADSQRVRSTELLCGCSLL
jgi:hypothetical protein